MYLYSLDPPKNPNMLDEPAKAGRQIFQREGCAGCHTPPLYTNNKVSATEAYARGFSWGLMQIMGQTAREKGVTVKDLSQLCDPVHGLEMGCQKLSDELHRLGGDVRAALLAYNGGGALHYPDQVLARMEHYQCQPPTTAP